MLQFNNVWKTYSKDIAKDTHIAVRDVSFQLHAGQTLGLIGANGAGKSTCLKLLMDFIRPDKGTIQINGESPQNHNIRSIIGYLPEKASFPSNLTILNMLKFTGGVCGLSLNEIYERSEKWLSYLELWDARHKVLSGYSKGMQQRASFAISLITNPDLLILDEPMSGLDPLGREKIISLILDLKKKGKLFYSVHICSKMLTDW